MLRFLPSFCTKSKLSIRGLQCRKYCEKSLDKNVKQSSEIHGTNPNHIPLKVSDPSSWNRTILVWTGIYKSKDEIPRNIPPEALHKAKNIARIRISNYMMLATVIACICFAISGRRAAERGESLAKMNLEWHRQIKEEADKENQSR